MPQGLEKNAAIAIFASCAEVSSLWGRLINGKKHNTEAPVSGFALLEAEFAPYRESWHLEIAVLHEIELSPLEAALGWYRSIICRVSGGFRGSSPISSKIAAKSVT